MADILVFPTIRNVLCEGDNLVKFTATAAIKAGQVVAFAAAGNSMAVLPAVKGVTGQPIGVAIEDIAITKEGPIAMDGCIVNVVNADDAADIAAGVIIEDNANAIGGTVSAMAMVEAGVVSVVKHQVGIMLDANVAATVGGGISRMLISCGLATVPMNA